MRRLINNSKRNIFCFLLFVLIFHSAPSFAEDFEYKLKAEFIERFTRFIEWPATSSLHESEIPFDICIVGNNPFGDYLTDLSKEVKIKGKPIRIKLLKHSEELNGCNIAFIAGSESPHLQELLKKTSESPVLTISDTPGFAEKGVLINFYRSGKYVRFEVNNAAAQRSGLRFSSRLLKLARLIETSDSEQGLTP